MENLRKVSGGVSAEGSEVLLGPAFAHTSVGMAIADAQGHFIEANSAFLVLAGRSAEELSRETVMTLTHEGDRAASAEMLRRLWAGEIPDFQLDKRYLRPDGTPVWVRNSVSLLRDHQGEPRFTIAISEDIDARRKAEAASTNARETLELATRAADLGTWDLDLLTGDLNWSWRCREIFGVGPNDPLTITDFYAGLHPDDREPLRAAIERALDPEVRETYNTEYRVIRPSGEERWAFATGKAVFMPGPDDLDDRAVRFVGIITDITERRRSIDALVQAEKLAATGRLAASIAHEINNPLEAVTNLLYLLRHETNRQQRFTYLALAEQELKRVSEIVTQTLRFYRDPSGPVDVDVADVLQSVVSLFQGRMTLRHVHVEPEFAANLAVHGSQGELRQVFLNFITNSLDAMPGGGRLLLRTHGGRDLVTGEPRVHVTIADTGEGMTQETVRRIFEPFFTTKKSTGTGLGLWLSLEILNKHGATVRVSSRVGKGTVIRVTFPSAEALALAALKQEPAASS